MFVEPLASIGIERLQDEFAELAQARNCQIDTRYLSRWCNNTKYNIQLAINKKFPNKTKIFGFIIYYIYVVTTKIQIQNPTYNMMHPRNCKIDTRQGSTICGFSSDPKNPKRFCSSLEL